MQSILELGWPLLSVSGFVSHLLALLLAISFVGWSLLGKKKWTTLQLLERFVIPHTNLQLGLLISAFIISYSSLTYLPYPNTPLWVLLLLAWVIFPLGMAYGWFAWLGLVKEEEVKEGRAFKDPEFPGLFIGLVAVICFFVFKPSLGESEWLKEKSFIVESLFGKKLPSNFTSSNEINATDISTGDSLLSEKVLAQTMSSNAMIGLHNSRSTNQLTSESNSFVGSLNDSLAIRISRHDYPGIIALFNEILEDSLSSYFESPRLYLQLGIAYYHTNQFEIANKIFKEIKDPEARDITDYLLWYQGRTAIQLGDTSEAQRYLCRLINEYNFQNSQARILINAYGLSCNSNLD